MKKILVFIGNFGSGKTELALNFALRAAKTGRTELIDLDMVNTYFRLSEYRGLAEDAGIRMVSPNYVMTNVESLSLPAEVASAFHMDWDTVVFDAGGDPAGATALGRFHENFAELLPGQLEVLHVVNARRPMSGWRSSTRTNRPTRTSCRCRSLSASNTAEVSPTSRRPYRPEWKWLNG